MRFGLTTTKSSIACAFAALTMLAGCATPADPPPAADAVVATPRRAPAPAPAPAPPAAKPAAPPAPVLTLSEQELAKGIKSYEDGEYKDAAFQLQAALNFGLAARADQVKAHKYLAFVHCVSSRSRQCRDEFRRALSVDPAFTLEPAEAGHPIWGPAYRAVKAEPVKPAAR
jgi:hypothetical protein